MKKIFLIQMLCFVFAFAAVAGENLSLAPLTQGDFGASSIQTLQKKSGGPVGPVVSQDPVSFSWNFKKEDPQPVLNYEPAVQRSKGFVMTVSGQDLNNGISLPLTQSEALVRLNPLSEDGALKSSWSIHPRDLVLVDGEGRVFDQGRGMEHLVDADSLAQSKSSGFPMGTSAFRVASDVVPGDVTLFSDRALEPNQMYAVHVLEKQSDISLLTKTASDTAFAGNNMTIFADFEGDADMAALSGTVIAPDGRQWPISFENGKALFRVPGDVSGQDGLFQVRVDAEGVTADSPVKRSGQTAFAVTVPTARLMDGVSVERSGEDLALAFQVEAAAAGRYEVRGMLYADLGDGEMRAVAMAHAADYLEPGNQALVLEYGAVPMAVRYEVRDLRLIHVDQMSVLHRQQVGVRLPLEK